MSVPFILREIEVDGHPVQCRFFQPIRMEDHVDYVCHYEIDWPNNPVVSKSFGVDAVQALLLAMQKAHVELLFGRDTTGLKVEWLEDEDLGLPIPENVKDWALKNSF